MKTLIVPYVSRLYGIEKALEVTLDDEDYESYKDQKFSVISRVGEDNPLYYFRLRKDGKYFYLHRLIARAASNKDQADHIDGDTLNNQRANLRVVTAQQNAINRHKTQKGVSGHHGVSLSKSGKYYVCISAYGIEYTGKYFSSLENALKARDQLISTFQGEYRSSH